MNARYQVTQSFDFQIVKVILLNFTLIKVGFHEKQRQKSFHTIRQEHRTFDYKIQVNFDSNLT